MRIDLSRYQNIAILTGAGVSVASGLRTYRGPNGVWEEHEVETYGTAQTLVSQPERTWQVFGGMRPPILTALPNAAHLALAHAEAALRPNQEFLLITQNVDGLHQRAGSNRVVELHGNVGLTRCTNEQCELAPFPDSETHADFVPKCPHCGSTLRPDVVLFGEPLPARASWEAKRSLRECELFIAIGTSGQVAPASTFVRSAEYAGARTVYLNLEPLSPKNPAFQEEYLGPAEVLVPELLGVSL